MLKWSYTVLESASDVSMKCRLSFRRFNIQSELADFEPDDPEA